MKTLKLLFFAIIQLSILAPVGWAQSLGTTNLLEGPNAGSDSVVLVANGAWLATANDPWLHLSAANQSGTGSATVIFTFDANPGATRMATLTISGQTLTVTQAGAAYIAITNSTYLVSSGLSTPSGMAVDGAGNVYTGDSGNNAIKEWLAASNTVTTLASLEEAWPWPSAVAVDGSDNVYTADYYYNAIEEWIAASNTVITLVSSGLAGPAGVAVDGAGNVYIADTYNNAIKEWLAVSNTVITLVTSGLSNPSRVAVDSLGNVYIADSGNNAVKEWVAASKTIITLVSSGLSGPTGLAVDGGGNVYIADTGNGAIKKYIAASKTTIALVTSGLSSPCDVTVDGSGNVYIADTHNNAIKELPHAFVDATIKMETAASGVDSLSTVLPTTARLTVLFAPVSDSSWLSITGVTNGVVSFAFTANTMAARTAHITLPGQSIAITQTGSPYFSSLSTTNLLEGQNAGGDSVVLVAYSSWTATPNDSWLHLSVANQNGIGSASVSFTFDANTGVARTGTLTIAGQTLTVTQAGFTYVAVTNATTLVSSGLSHPVGVAVDSVGNVYIADRDNNVIKEWVAASNTVITPIPSGFDSPQGVALDSAGNVYIDANYGVFEWVSVSNAVITLASSGLFYPTALALDSLGNVYIANTYYNEVKECLAGSNTLVTLISSGLSYPRGLAVDSSGNVYIADQLNNAVKEWVVASNAVIMLASSGLNYPLGVAVDWMGNVYIADTGNNSIKEWIAATNGINTLLSSGLSSPSGVALDNAGNVYIADTQNNAIKELVRAFVDTAGKVETAAAGNDVLPTVLPATVNLTGPFAPISDSRWLTITRVTNGVVSFAFTANNYGSRTAHIQLFGLNIAVTQLGPPYYSSLGTTNYLEGPIAGSDSVSLIANGSWTAAVNASWLHLSAANQSGAGNTSMFFTFDANPGATRIGTLTIAGITITVTQAGSTYVAAKPISLVSTGLSGPSGMAMDSMGNLFFADSGNNAIKEWVVASNNVITLTSSELGYPTGVALDSNGNVWFADTVNGAIKEWIAASNTVVTPIFYGFYYPNGVAVDAEDNVYIADTYNNAIEEWIAASATLKTLVSSGLRYPVGVAVDDSGYVYIADSENNAIKEWIAVSNSVITLISSGLNYPVGMVLDSAGNVLFADTGNGAIKEWWAASNTVTTLVSSGLASPQAVVKDALGNLYITDSGNGAIKELVHAFVDPTPKTETAEAGSDSIPVVVPATANLTGPLAPVSDSPWLTITGVTNGVVSFAFTANTSSNQFVYIRTAQIKLYGLSIPVTQAATPPYFSLAITNLLECPTAGSDSVALAANSTWTATANDSWLHLSTASQCGIGNAYVVFTFDANPGATRTGTLTIAGQTLSVTQAGSTYVAVTNVTTVVSSGLSSPYAVAVDGSGNIYIADTSHNAIKEWVATSNTVITLVSSGFNYPSGVAVDSMGNIYIADARNNAIKEWVATSNTVITLVSSGLYNPQGVAVDGLGNVYFVNNIGNGLVEEWLAASDTVIALVSGLANLSGVAVDGAGDVYFTEYQVFAYNVVKEWIAANNTIIMPVPSGLNSPSGVAVDRFGNIYIADSSDNAIKKWVASSNSLVTLVSSGLSHPCGVAVDGAGNVYIADTLKNAIKELPCALVDTASKVETAAAGNDILSTVLPATANLTGPFAPVSDSWWLTVTGVSNGMVSFSFTADDFANRTAHLTVLGQSIAVTQLGPPNYVSLGTTNLLEGPNAGSDSMVLAANSAWTATANSTWLHLNAANQIGPGSANVIFAFDANSGATRTGTLTIAGQMLTVTQAGSAYVATTNTTTLQSTSPIYGPGASAGVAVDGVGNVYIADSAHNTIKKWSAASNTVTTLVSSGLSAPNCVAVDGVGNVYIADTGHSAIKEWIAASNIVITLVSSGLNRPYGVAVDDVGNVYIADRGNSAIKECIAASNIVTTLVSSGLSSPSSVAVDGTGNVYIADTGNNAIKEWMVFNKAIVTLVSSGLHNPYGVAVDGSGSVFIADTYSYAIKKWLAASNTVTALVSSGLALPTGVAVDGADNVYIADYNNNAVRELAHAFVDPTAKTEPASGDSDTLPVVLPATANLTGPFVPVSNFPWLTITGVTNGVVSFAITANPSPTNRTANITLLGMTIPVTQNTALVLTGIAMLKNGSFQFGFSNNQSASFTVWTTTNLSLPLANWTMLGPPGNLGSGQFQFTDPAATNDVQRFYRVSSP